MPERGDVNKFFMNVTKIILTTVPDFSLKMHQIQFSTGALPRSRWGAHSATPDLLAGFGEKGKERRKGETEGKGGRGRGGERGGKRVVEGRDGERERGRE